MFKTKKTRFAAPSLNGAYASSDVARISGVSLRQLQWWDEQKVVSPRQNGHKRVYLPNEVVEVTVIAELRRKGFSLQKIRRPPGAASPATFSQVIGCIGTSPHSANFCKLTVQTKGGHFHK